MRTISRYRSWGWTIRRRSASKRSCSTPRTRSKRSTGFIPTNFCVESPAQAGLSRSCLLASRGRLSRLPHQSKSGNAGDGSQMVGQEKTPPKRGQKAKGISGIGGRGASAAGQFRARGIVPTGKVPPKRAKVSVFAEGGLPQQKHRDGRIGSRKNSPAEAGPSVRVVWAQGRLRYSHPLANGQGAVGPSGECEHP